MKTNRLKSLIVLLMTLSLALSAGVVQAAQPIVIGCPLATAFLYGWDAERGVTLAVEEINAASNEQASNVEQVNKAMDQVDQTAQQSAASSEELASTAEEMSAQTEELKETVGFFKLAQ